MKQTPQKYHCHPKERGLAFPYAGEAVVVEFQPITVNHCQRIKKEKVMEFQPITVNQHQRIKGEKVVEFQPITMYQHQRIKGGKDRGLPANYHQTQNENTSQTSKLDTAKSSFDETFQEGHDNLLQISLALASPFPSDLNESTQGEVPESSSSVRDGAITLDSLLEEHNRQKHANK